MDEITAYLKERGVSRLDAAYGCSLGGACLTRMLALVIIEGLTIKTRIRENGNRMNPRANARFHNLLFHYIVECVLMATGIAEHIHSAQSAQGAFG